MNEEAMLVEAILSERDDHVHRLVYADWLLDNDPAREPLVRAQALLGPSLWTVMGQKLVPIPPGTFVMGSPEDEKHRDPDELAHEVTLRRGYYLGAHPVTVGEFAAFVRDTRYETEAEQTSGVGWVRESGTWERGPFNWRTPGWWQSQDDPVVCLSWADALAYCRWLSSLEGEEGRTYRLPTEAEWEYACRAGTTTPFYFGDDLLPGQACYNLALPYSGRKGRPSNEKTVPVGSYPANAFGLWDMHGNAWEWCHDWYDPGYYEGGAMTDPTGPEIGFGRVLRGGSWCNEASDCRSALRRCGNPRYSRYRDGNTGFRLALSLPKAEAKKGRGRH